MLASPTSNTRMPFSRARTALFLVALFSFFFSAYVFTASADFFGNGDTLIRIEIAENLEGGHLDLDGWKLEYPHHLKKEYYDPRIDICHRTETCSTYLLGQPLAIYPFDRLGQAITVHERWPFGPGVLMFDRLVGPLFGALEVLVFFLFCIRLGYSLRRSLLLTAVLGFATSVWPDEQSVLEHTEVAFFLLLGMYFAFRFRDGGGRELYLVWAGAAVGGAAITRSQDALLGAFGIAVYLLWPGGPARGILPRVRWLILCAVGLLPFSALDMWWDWVRFGSVFASGHHESVFGYPPWQGAAGLLVSPGKGILWYCPTLFLLAIAGPMFSRRFSALSAGITVLSIGFIFFYANVTYWHGDPAWGPRYIYPAIPFLTLPLGELFRRSIRFSAGIRVATVLVILGSLAVQVAAVSVSQWRGYYKIIAYEENQGHQWTWIASRYRYFWNYHESPLNFQIHGFYNLAYDSLRNSNKYELIAPDEDPILDKMTVDYAINQWNFWWASNEYNWWMGEQKIALIVVMLLGIMTASGVYLVSEASGLFMVPVARRAAQPLPEAA